MSNNFYFFLRENSLEIIGDTTTLFGHFLQVCLALALLQLAVPVAAAGGSVQAQELLAHTHLLDVSDGVVPLSEQLQRDRIYREIRDIICIKWIKGRGKGLLIVSM